MEDGGIETRADRTPRRDDSNRAGAAGGTNAVCGAQVRPVTERTFYVLFAPVLTLLALSAAGQLVLSGQPRLIAQAATMLICSVVTTSLAMIGIVRTRGVDRRWRLLVAAGPLSSIPAAIEWTIQYSSGNPVTLKFTPIEGLFLLAPILTTAGLICMPAASVADGRPTRAPPQPATRWTPRYSHTIITLDSLLIVLSMLLIAWYAQLRYLTRTVVSGTSFIIAVAFILTAAMMLVVLILVAAFRQPHNGRALALLACGILATAVSETALVRLSLPGEVDVQATLPQWIGAAAGPLLVAFAMIAPERVPAQPPLRGSGTAPTRRHRRPDIRPWLHAYLPYLPLSVAAALVLATAVRNGALRGLPLYLAIGLATLVSLRQIVSVTENRRLVADVKLAHHRLQYQADHDGLTGLANRALFTRELEHAVTAHRDRGRPVVVLFCDIDHFKTVNDTHGHHAGDQLLRTVAARLHTAVRQDDL
ncbi:GGDEF domain-containing protein, partial [Parafrankia sp. EUN1f]|uniref:GGDEF domain-containing protein n=1 Tax=Parafrankia sp. EUN1f TaxID=102897 RepID=UPI0001C46C3A